MIHVRPTTAQLKHLPFFAAIAHGKDGLGDRESAAILLSLRFLDTWRACGVDSVSSDTVLLTETRKAVAALDAASPMRAVLFRLLGTIQTRGRVDITPIAPILYACAAILEDRVRLDLAADVYESALAFAHPHIDADMFLDILLKLARCHREIGNLDMAESLFQLASGKAEWHADRQRALRCRIGLASVMRVRGDLPAADVLFEQAALDARQIGSRSIEALVLMDHGILAQQMGDPARAICLSSSALEVADSEHQREKIFGNIAAFLILLGRNESARDALLLQEAIAMTDRSRIVARINLLALAARTGDAVSFDALATGLLDMPMGADDRVNYLIESARGLEAFGRLGDARESLLRAIHLAEGCGMSRALFEAEGMLASLGQRKHPGDSPPIVMSEEVARVELGLRAKASALAR